MIPKLWSVDLFYSTFILPDFEDRPARSNDPKRGWGPNSGPVGKLTPAHFTSHC